MTSCKFCGWELWKDDNGIGGEWYGKPGKKHNDICPNCGAGYNRFQVAGGGEVDHAWDEPGTHEVEDLRADLEEAVKGSKLPKIYWTN